MLGTISGFLPGSPPLTPTSEPVGGVLASFTSFLTADVRLLAASSLRRRLSDVTRVSKSRKTLNIQCTYSFHWLFSEPWHQQGSVKFVGLLFLFLSLLLFSLSLSFSLLCFSLSLSFSVMLFFSLTHSPFLSLSPPLFLFFKRELCRGVSLAISFAATALLTPPLPPKHLSRSRAVPMWSARMRDVHCNMN